MFTKPIPLIYIAGPFRGPTPLAVCRNVEAARDLGIRVAEAGGYPMIPHTMTAHFDKLLTDQFWLDGTMEMLKRCDAIVLTHTWEKSTGATAEHDWATQHAMPIYIDVDPAQAYIMGRNWPLQQFVSDVRARVVARSTPWPNRIAETEV